MKRFSCVCVLFHPTTLFIVASLLTQHSAFGQKGINLPGSASTPVTGEEKAALAFRDRCLLLSTKFKHNGVEFQSKSGIGCVIATPQGQRILAMPLSMTQPIEVLEGNEPKAKAKLSIPSSLLLAAKIGSDKRSRERLDAFDAQVADLPTVNSPKDFALESERKIFLALNERGEVAFNGTPLSGVMKFFRNSHTIPIVFDEKALEIEGITPDEPITLELPQVAFRSALNLILEPLKLTYVIQNEVLKITSRQAAGNSGIDFPDHEQVLERRIHRALNERGEVSFNGTPITGVMRFFMETHQIPIVIDERALEIEGITPDEPITLELPQVAFRSALNLILDPLKLTYLVENEVLKITTKTAASVELDTPKAVRTSQMGTLAYSFSAMRGIGGMGIGGMGGGGMGGGMGGTGGRDCYGLASVQRYRTFQEAQSANQNSIAPPSITGGPGMGGGGIGGNPNERREYAAIHGPLAVQVNTDLGVAFVSLPGDFQSIPIPTRVDLTRKQSVMVEDGWQAIADIDASRPSSALEGSPVVDEQGEPVGMYVGGKVVSFPQLFEALLSLDTKSLGFWGPESTKMESQIVEGLPELIPAELKSQIEKTNSLQGKEKAKAMNQLRTLLSTQVEDRYRFAERRLNALRSKLDALTRLSYAMKKKDISEVNKILPKELSLKISETKEEDPFK